MNKEYWVLRHSWNRKTGRRDKTEIVFKAIDTSIKEVMKQVEKLKTDKCDYTICKAERWVS